MSAGCVRAFLFNLQQHLVGGGLEELELLLQRVRQALGVQEGNRLLVHVGAQVARAVAQQVALLLQLVALLRAQRDTLE